MDGQAVREHLAGGTLLFDGATGTYARTIPGWPEEAVERACLSAPDKVLALHLAYLHAGCAAIKTNTFAAHVGLAAQSEAQQRDMIGAAVEIARRAAQGNAFVFADIGPAPQDAPEAYVRMAQIFLDCGVSCFLMETMHACEGLAEAAACIKERNPHAFVAVSFAAGPDGFTRAGEAASSLIARMDGCPHVDAVGLNCVCGAYHMRRLLEALPHTKKPLIAMPNAAYPHVIDGRTYYDGDPAYFAQQAAACAALGARLIGGCCGTTPAHIRRLAERLPRQAAHGAGAARDAAPAGEARACRSRIAQKLARGARVTLVELDPPRDSGIASFLEGAKALAQAGADAVTIADCPIGRARMDASLLACKLSRELGIEALPHMTCRDRNVNATKALLLGLSMEGVHNVLAVTGDPIPADDRDSVKSVF